MDPLPRLLVDLAQASARAHTEATLVDAITHTLQGHFALRSCTRTQTPVERSETRWVLPLATGALVAEVDAWPTWFDDDARHAVTAMIAVGFDHVAVLTRVAELSRRAHHDRRALRDELARHVAWDAPTLPSPAMRRLFDETLPAVARYAVTMLLCGESGVGKDVVARRIHALSPRAARPFVAINCGAVPDALLESALFGHERGAFTGAHTRRLGCFERAHGETLQLDEVGELSPHAQVRLLRVLQTGSSNAWAAKPHCASTCASSPPHTAISQPWSPREPFASTSTNACVS